MWEVERLPLSTLTILAKVTNKLLLINSVDVFYLLGLPTVSVTVGHFFSLKYCLLLASVIPHSHFLPAFPFQVPFLLVL